MNSLALHAVKQAILARIQENKPLMAMVQNVFVLAPRREVLPYIVLDDGVETPLPGDAALGRVVNVQLRVRHYMAEQKALLDIMEQLHHLFHHASFALLHGRLLSVRVTQSQTANRAEKMLEGQLTLRLLISSMEGV